METKNVALLVAAVLAVGCNCGGKPPLMTPFSGLQAGVCLADSDCDIGRCPNACHFGQPFCEYPKVFARADVLRKCPCVDTPSAAGCEEPPGEACGAIPECAGPQDVQNLRARCIQGMCAARMTDGGVPP